MFIVCVEFRRYINGEDGTSIERQRIHKVFEPSTTLAEIEEWVKNASFGVGSVFSVSIFPEGTTWARKTDLTVEEIAKILDERIGPKEE